MHSMRLFVFQTFMLFLLYLGSTEMPSRISSCWQVERFQRQTRLHCKRDERDLGLFRETTIALTIAMEWHAPLELLTHVSKWHMMRT